MIELKPGAPPVVSEDEADEAGTAAGPAGPASEAKAPGSEKAESEAAGTGNGERAAEPPAAREDDAGERKKEEPEFAEVTVPLNSSHVGTDSGDDCERVLWHFVLVGLGKGASTATLYATFADAGEVSVQSYKQNLQMQHFAIETGPDVLTGAYAVVTTSSDKARLNLSDFSCTGEGGLEELDLSIDKEACVETVEAGGIVEYRIRVCNDGGEYCENVRLVDDYDESAVEVVDARGAVAGEGRLHWVFDLAPGQCRVFTYAVQACPELDPGFEICNYATASCGDESESDFECVRVVARPNGEGIELSIDKEADADTVEPGDTIEYTIEIRNEGETACEDVTVVDDYDEMKVEVVDAGGGAEVDGTLQWTGDLDPGERVTLEYAMMADAELVDGDAVRNLATVSCEGEQWCDEECVEVVDEEEIDLEIDKQADVTTVTAGGMVEYTIEVTNAGEDDCADALLVDDYDETLATIVDAGGATDIDGELHWVFDIEAGETLFFTYTATVSSAAETGTEVCNVATVTCGEESEYDEECVTVVAPPAVEVVDIEVDKDADKETVAPGGTIAYTIVVSNLGGTAAEDVLVTDDFDEDLVSVLDAGGGTVTDGTIVWTVDIGAGEDVTLGYTVRVDADATDGTVVRNTVVAEHEEDSDSDSEDVEVVAAPVVTPGVEEEPEPFLPFTEGEPSLPFTGGEAWLLALAALAAGGFGGALRRRGRGA